MIVYKCSLALANKNEWLQYISKVLDVNHTNNPDELLRKICNFDFIFETTAI